MFKRKSSFFAAFIARLRCQIDLWVLAFVVMMGTLFATLSVMRYAGYNAGMLDLGNISQSIASVMRGQPLEFTYKMGNYSRLALHVELFFFLLAPLYAVFPSPVTLLICQALGFVVGAFPLFSLARRKLENVLAARLIVLIYLLYPVALTAILFDVHGDTFAMPVLLFMLDALDRKAWRSYWIWMLLALSCKFYIAVPIAVVGGLLYLKDTRRVGLTTVIVCLLWGGIAFLVVRPFFSPRDMVEVQSTAGGYFLFYFGRIQEAFLPQSLMRRFMTAIIVFLPALWLGRRALLWLLPACAIALPALLSIGSVSTYDYRFHHYAVAVPFLLNAVIEGAVVLRQRQRETPVTQKVARPWRWEVAMTLGITLLFTILLIDLPLSPWFWVGLPGWGLDDRAYGRTMRDALKDQWLQTYVPKNASVATSMYLAPHLVNRETLYLFLYSDGQDLETMMERRLSKVDYAIADALFDYTVPAQAVLGEQLGLPTRFAFAGVAHPTASVGTVLHDAIAVRYLLTSPDFGLVEARDGLLLFQRGAPLEARLEQTVTLRVPDVTPAVPSFDFDNGIGLLDVQVTSLGDRHYVLEFRWVALDDLQERPQLFAVTRLEGISQVRMVHLPTQVLVPTTTWSPEMVVDERMEIVLPANVSPGQYPLWVGWYDPRHLEADDTDARGRVGSELRVAVIEVP